MAVALLLRPLKWARVAATLFVVIAGTAYFLLLMGTIVPFGVVTQNFWGSAMALEGLGLLACLMLINVGCGDRREFRWFGLAACTSSLVLALLLIWNDIGDTFLSRLDGALIAASLVFAHANLILMARLQAGQRWVQWATLASSCVCGMCVAIEFLGDYQARHDLPVLLRISVATGIAAGSGSIALIVLSMFNRRIEADPTHTTEFKEITVFCPNCSTQQALPLDGASCRVCALQILVKVIEPHCPACGYLLYRITSDRCPECGAAIRREEARVPPAAPDSTAGTALAPGPAG
jgi:hypothetical protein